MQIARDFQRRSFRVGISLSVLMKNFLSKTWVIDVN